MGPGSLKLQIVEKNFTLIQINKKDCIYNSCPDHEQKSTPFGSKAKAVLQTQKLYSRKKQKSSSLRTFFLKPNAIFKQLWIQKKI